MVNFPENPSIPASRRVQMRIALESAVLAWSTQLTFCAGLFEFSRIDGQEEALGIGEFVSGINELASQATQSSPGSRRASSEYEDLPSPKLSASDRVRTSSPLSESPWLTISPRLTTPPSSSSPVEASPLEVSISRKAPYELDSAPKNAWISGSKRPEPTSSPSSDRPSGSTWSSATRPSAARNNRNNFINPSGVGFADPFCPPPLNTSAALGSNSSTANSSPTSSWSTSAPPSAPTSPPSSVRSAPATENNSPAGSPTIKFLSASQPVAYKPIAASAKLPSAKDTALAPVRSLTQTLAGQFGLKKKNNKFNSPAAIAKQLGLEDLPPKQFSKLPAVSVATVSLVSASVNSLGQWFSCPMRLRIHNAGTHTALALYTNDNVQLGIQVPIISWRMNAYSQTPTEPVIASLTSVSNEGYPLSIFMDSTHNFFWIREGPGLNSSFLLFSATDMSSMTSYLRSTLNGVNFGQMKPGAYMAIFMHGWIETCLDGIPPEPKRAFDLAAVDKTASKNMLESLELFETIADQLPTLIQALHWYPYLCDITLFGCGIGDDQAVPILHWITLNSQIKSLSLASNNLSSGSVASIHGLLTRSSKRLMILDLSDNPFSNKAIAGILEALAQNMSVKRFTMSGVPITSKSALVGLTQLLLRNRSLLSLRVSIKPAQNAEAVAETFLAPIFAALLNNTAINALDLGIPQGSPTLANIMQLVTRNAKGPSSVTLAGWLPDWPKLLDFAPTTTDHYQKLMRSSEKTGISWKNVASFTGTMEEGPIGTLTVSRESIVFSSSGSSSPSSNNGSHSGLNGSNGSSGSEEVRSFTWTSSLKIGQLTTDPVLLVFYDPARFPDPLVVTMATSEQLLEAAICLNALELAATAKPTTRGRAQALGTTPNTSIEYFLDFSKATLGDLLAPVGGSGTEVRIAKLVGFDCCVKVMDCSLYGQDAVDSMEKEISLLIMSKRCKNIVQYLHHGRTGHQLRLYMELFPGSLRKLVVSRAENGSHFTPLQVYTLARRMLKALNFLHTQPQPIVHRDIKTDNFLVEEDVFGNFVRVKLTDFGSAKILTRGRTSSIDQGTSGYQAPEMLRGPEAETEDGNSHPLSYTTAVDIFAFGITLYEILALQKVYPHCNSRQDLEEALRNAEKFPPDYQLVPRGLLHFLLVVSPCLKKNYMDRPTAAELIVQLDKVAEELKVSKLRTSSLAVPMHPPAASIIISPRPH